MRAAYLPSTLEMLAGGCPPGALPAADPGLNLAISFNGMSLVQDGNATATTASGEYGLAIAYGDGASATAEGGTGNYALADGTNAGAANLIGNADGPGSGSYNTAIDIDNNASGTFDVEILPNLF